MLLTLLMLGLALGCAAIGIWAMRRPTVKGDSASEPNARPARQSSLASSQPPVTELQQPERSAFAAAAGRHGATVPSQAGETRPDVLTRAFLDFDGRLGRVHIERPEVVIGRHTQDDIRISDVRVSRHHARLVARRDGGFEIHNLTAVRSEPNPMQINGETREHADIVDGDVVTLGGVSFVFRMAA